LYGALKVIEPPVTFASARDGGRVLPDVEEVLRG
jgi:hypothetical protein